VESITDVISLIRFFQKVFLCKNLGIFRELQNQEEVVILKQSSIIITSITGTQWIEGEEGIIKYRDNIGNLWILSGILLEPLLKAREIDKLQKKIAKLKNDLDNPEFLRYASGALVEQYNSDLSSTNMMLQCILQCN
jgi:valyl-tRNA synthetase